MSGIPLPCPLCGGTTSPLSLTTGPLMIGYLRCEDCGFIGMEPSYSLSPVEEKTRYLLHRNEAANSGYMDFLSAFIDKALTPFKKPGARILDFGSGPSPILAKMTTDMGYRCDMYDPFFARTRSWEDRFYEAILLHEVAEHLREPGKVLSTLAERVAAGGIIAIRTRFLPETSEGFQNWWYRMDRTHVSFFTPSCLAKFFESRGFTILLLEKPDIIVVESARHEDVLW